MSSINRVYQLLKKDIILEFRSLYAVGSILLYVVTTVFIVYKAFNTLQPQVWNSMFWVLFLFAAVNATLRSFSKMSAENSYFNYSYLNPTEFIIGKMLFNFLFLLIIAVLTFVVMALFFEHPVADFGLFTSAVLIASIGVSIVCSFSSAASTQGSSNATVMSVLSLPLSIPILLLTLKVSMQSMRLLTDTSIGSDFSILGGIIILMLSGTLLLFPYLWKS